MNLEAEYREGYLISKEMKQLWHVQLELLSELQRVCDILGIKLFASGGTLLGGVRHKGFIPWDDDIDVILFRKDYERLLKEGPKILQEKYFLQSTYSDKIMRVHAQLRKNGTTCLLKGDYKAKYHRGVFIDIFIFDKIPEDEKERLLFKQSLMKEWNRINKPKFVCSKKHSKLVLLAYNFSIILLKRFLWDVRFAFCDRKKRFKKFETLCKKYNETDSRFISNVSFRGINPKTSLLPFELKWFDNPTKIKFEDFYLYGPSEYDKYLRLQYGNYKEYVVGGSFHGDLFFDVFNDYTKYSHLSSKNFLKLFDSN